MQQDLSSSSIQAHQERHSVERPARPTYTSSIVTRRPTISAAR